MFRFVVLLISLFYFSAVLWFVVYLDVRFDLLLLIDGLLLIVWIVST